MCVFHSILQQWLLLPRYYKNYVYNEKAVYIKGSRKRIKCLSLGLSTNPE